MRAPRPRATLLTMTEKPLMPSSTPREEDRRPRERRLLSTLDAQLRALDRDIAAARRQARHAPSLDLGHHDPLLPRRGGELVRLRSGFEILVRPVEPEDAAALRAGFEQLGEVSRYRRFLTEVSHLTPSQIAAMTNVDHVQHEALAAIDAATGEGVGVARYVIDRADPRRAEFAMTIVDEWQGRGVGTALLERLVARARSARVEVFTARTLVGNDAARRMLAHCADIVSEQRDADTVRFTARLRR
jgi:RimJ/RimL family protein N-acetyltransferase